jgi:hypothetical protein
MALSDEQQISVTTLIRKSEFKVAGDFKQTRHGFNKISSGGKAKIRSG